MRWSDPAALALVLGSCSGAEAAAEPGDVTCGGAEVVVEITAEDLLEWMDLHLL